MRQDLLRVLLRSTPVTCHGRHSDPRSRWPGWCSKLALTTAGGRDGKKHLRSLVAAAVLLSMLLVPRVSTRADEVRLETGDVIHGEVVTADDKTLRMKHVFGSELSLPWDKITAIETEKPVELKLYDGTRLQGRLRHDAVERSLVCESEAAGRIEAIEVDRVVAINEPPEEALWTGRIQFGLTQQTGNTKSESVVGSFEGERRTSSDRIETRASYTFTKTEGELSAKRGYTRIQYSYYVHTPLYIYVGGAMEYDKFKDLRLRSRSGGGLGYALFETRTLVVRVEGGIEYANEDYFDPTGDNDFASARGALNSDWRITSWLRLSESAEIFPDLERSSDYVVRSITSANMSLLRGFGLAVNLVWEHDHRPAPGARRDDLIHILTLTYSF
ncbi:YdiY family protein [Planctomycetota bacterium]